MTESSSKIGNPQDDLFDALLIQDAYSHLVLFHNLLSFRITLRKTLSNLDILLIT